MRTGLGDTVVTGWRGRGERVSGIALPDQLFMTNLSNVSVAISAAPSGRLLLRRFLRSRGGRAHRRAVTVRGQPDRLADHLDGLLRVPPISEIREIAGDFGRIGI